MPRCLNKKLCIFCSKEQRTLFGITNGGASKQRLRVNEKAKYSEVGLSYYFVKPVMMLWEQIYIKMAYKVDFTVISDAFQME